MSVTRQGRRPVAGLAATVAAFWIASAAAQTAPPVDLSPDQARALSFHLVVQGRYAEASDLAQVLTARDPRDQGAWLALAQAERGLRQSKRALYAAKQAWKLAETPPERYASALVASQTLSSDGKFTRSQLWLRRAAQHAPQPGQRARAVAEFRAVRAANPLSVQLSFSVAPNSNINNGAKSDRVPGGTITGSALALSGVEVGLGVNLRYRLKGSDRASPYVGLSVNTLSYSLSDSAKAISPASRGSDYNFQEVELTYGTRLVNAAGTRLVDLSANLGANMQGGDHLSDFAGLSAAVTLPRDDKSFWRLGGGVERIERRDFSNRSATVTQAFGSWSKVLDGGDGLSFTVNAKNSASASFYTDYSSISLGAGYTWADAPMGTRVALSLSLEARNFHQPVPIFGDRMDRKAALGVSVTLKDRDYYGFAPVIGLNASTTASSVDLYDTETLGLRFGLTSAF